MNPDPRENVAHATTPPSKHSASDAMTRCDPLLPRVMWTTAFGKNTIPIPLATQKTIRPSAAAAAYRPASPALKKCLTIRRSAPNRTARARQLGRITPSDRRAARDWAVVGDAEECVGYTAARASPY